MPAQAMTKSRSTRSFNPSEYRADFSDLMAVNPGLAANAATALARSKRDAEKQVNISDESKADIVAFGVSTLIVAAIGMYDGTVMAKRDQIIEDFESQGLIAAGEEPPADLWKAQGIKDPGKVLGFFPKSLLVPIILGVATVGAAAGREEDDPPSILERSLAVSTTTTFGLFVAGLTRAHGYRWQQKRMLAAANAAGAMTGT